MIYSGIKMILKKFREMLLEDEYRVGRPYFTFDQDDDPNDHLPGTWERLPDGVFIRNAGGNAGTVGQTQAEGLPNILGQAGPMIVSNAHSEIGALTISSGSARCGSPYGSGNSWGHIQTLASEGEVKANGTYKNDVFGKSDHVTPFNVALYMWRRTA